MTALNPYLPDSFTSARLNFNTSFWKRARDTVRLEIASCLADENLKSVGANKSKLGRLRNHVTSQMYFAIFQILLQLLQPVLFVNRWELNCLKLAHLSEKRDRKIRLRVFTSSIKSGI